MSNLYALSVSLEEFSSLEPLLKEFYAYLGGPISNCDVSLVLVDLSKILSSLDSCALFSSWA